MFHADSTDGASYQLPVWIQSRGISKEIAVSNIRLQQFTKLSGGLSGQPAGYFINFCPSASFSLCFYNQHRI